MIKYEGEAVELNGKLTKLMSEATTIVQVVALQIDKTEDEAEAERLKVLFSDSLIDAIYLDPEEFRKKIREKLLDEIVNALERSADDGNEEDSEQP